MEAPTPKHGGKTASSSMMHKISLRFWCRYLHQPKIITAYPYHFISTLLKTNFSFDVSIANDIAIDVAMYALPGKVRQGSPCQKVHALTKENKRYILNTKRNDT